MRIYIERARITHFNFPSNNFLFGVFVLAHFNFQGNHFLFKVFGLAHFRSQGNHFLFGVFLCVGRQAQTGKGRQRSGEIKEKKRYPGVSVGRSYRRSRLLGIFCGDLVWFGLDEIGRASCRERV